VLASGPAVAQDAESPTIHWAYASYFGTGWYRLNERQSAFILSLKPGVLGREFEWPPGGDRSASFRLRAPLSVGIANLDFDDVPGIVDPDNLSMVSGGIGGDVELPLTSRLSLRPNAELSYGVPVGESQYAWSYRVDLRGRYAFEHGKLDWWFQGSAGAVGYESNRGPDDRFTYAGIGVEFAYPLTSGQGEDNPSVLYWHANRVHFFDEISVQRTLDVFDSVTNYWQIGAAFGKRDGPLTLWFLRFDRLGLSYNFSPSGELRGLELVFRSTYEP